MRDLVSAEFLKLRTTRTFWWVSLFAVGLSVLFTVAQLATDDIRSEADLRLLLSNITAASILVIVLGVVGSAGEFRHGTITSTFLVGPDRTRVLVAKGIAYGLAGLLIWAVTAAFTLVVALPWISVDGTSFSEVGLSTAELAGILAGTMAVGFIAGLFGVAIGSLVTNQLGAVMIVVVLIFVIDPILTGLFHGYTRFSLAGLVTSMSGSSASDSGLEGDLLSPGVAALVFCGYATALLGTGAAIMRRRDIA